jgi:hypothetical protein
VSPREEVRNLAVDAIRLLEPVATPNRPTTDWGAVRLALTLAQHAVEAALIVVSRQIP